MRVLVVGGAASGKSAYAERLACALSPNRTYVATMESVSDEAKRRIARHRAQRAGLGFNTLECPNGTLPWAEPPWGASDRALSANESVALVEDLGNLVANALFFPDGTMADPQTVTDVLTRNVMGFCRAYDHVIVVGNLVGCSGESAYAATRAWVRVVGTLCCRLAASFDVVVEVVTGIPKVRKGELP